VQDRQGKLEEAEEMNRQTLAQGEKVIGHDHLDRLTSVGMQAGGKRQKS
jgi:hypothetical protein